MDPARFEEEERVRTSVHAMLGVPADSDASDDLLLDRGEYVLSYHPKRNVANWVSFRLTKEDLGAMDRSDDFRADDLLPAALYHVTPSDYLHSGFDRGHLCPSGDRTRTHEENSRTFLMTNMHPQRPEMNRVTWKNAEEYERKLIAEGAAELFIVVGGIFSSTDSASEKMNEKIAVPSAGYRIVVATPHAKTASDVRKEAGVIATIIPNTADVKEHPWLDYVTTVDEIERVSGYDFLARIPDEVEEILEKKRAIIEMTKPARRSRR